MRDALSIRHGIGSPVSGSFWSAARLCTVLALFTIAYAPVPRAEERGEGVTFALVGDIMLGSDFPDSLKKKFPWQNGALLLSKAENILAAADVAIGNLEGPITCADSCTKVLADSVAYGFRMPPVLAGRLVEAGFDVLTTANNHVNDFGEPGRRDTESILDSLGIAHTGRPGNIAELTVGGRNVAVAGFSPSPGNHPLLDIDRAVDLVRSLDDTHDIVVVSFHGGGEGRDFLHLPDGPECYLTEDRGDLRRFARAVVDAGADIVFGHGPHVPRALEVYRRRLIAYSLGNFCTWFGINVRDENGLAPLLWAELGRDGVLRSFTIVSFQQQSFHYPVPDSRRQAELLIRKLSEADLGVFPEEYYRETPVIADP